MKKGIIILVLPLLFAACNKNQKRANKLEGNWNTTSFIFNSPGESGSTYNDIEEDDRTITFEFLPCDLDSDEDCICNWQTIDFEGNATDVQYVYTVQENGDELFLDEKSSEFDDLYTITEFSKSNLKMNRTNSNGSTVFLELEKID